MALSGKASSFRRLVIVHQGALGDFLLALPVFEGIHLKYPEVGMDFCAKAEYVALLADRPYVGEIHSSYTTDVTLFFHDDLWRHAPVPHYFQNASQIFIFGQKSSRLLAERFSARLDYPVRWIQSFPDPGHLQPVAEFLLRQVNQLGFGLKATIPHLEPPVADRAEARRWLKSQGRGASCRPVVLHPGSGGKRKIWPLARWWELIGWLDERYQGPIVLSLGPADDYLRTFAEEARETLGVCLFSEAKLPHLASLLSESALYVGNDSGVSHLAAAVGIPTVVIFGPTDPKVWGPVGVDVHIVRSHWQENDILVWSRHLPPPSVEPAVCEVVARLLDCHPAY